MPSETKDEVVVLGRDRLPTDGILLIPNILPFHDLLLLEDQLSDRPITYLIEEGSLFDPLLQAHLEKDGVQALEFSVNEELLPAIQKPLRASLDAGQRLVFVPGLAATRIGAITAVPSSTLAFLMKIGVPSQPLFIEHPDDTRLSIEPKPEEPTIIFSFGEALGETATVSDFQEQLFLASHASFDTRPILEGNLGYCLLQGLKKHGSTAKVVHAEDKKEVTYEQLLATAIVLSKQIRSQTQKKRVGIVLPPCIPALLANIATLFAGKTPVNLNFTASESAVQYAMDLADLDLFITVDPFVRKTQRFPWPPNRQIIFVERWLPTAKFQIIRTVLTNKILPASAIASSLGLSKKGGEEEAILLFTSGSSGNPKGVVLSHRNVLANVNQFASRIQLHSQDNALGCLPVFHSFGCTVTMWYPVIDGVNLVTHPSPLDTKKLAGFLEDYRISLLVATPTFLRGYLRHATKEQFETLKLIITGAEKLPAKIANEFEKKFGKPVLEGYGLTETSPVTNVNLPDPIPDDPLWPVLSSSRQGSVGHFIPGMAVRITDPETDEPLPLHQTGMIWLKGPNIFREYLNQPKKTADVIQDGWFRTGDIGRVDE
ncbi:MAG: AMP-binding protein, partial [Verrucomicrobiota bacterium]